MKTYRMIQVGTGGHGRLAGTVRDDIWIALPTDNRGRIDDLAARPLRNHLLGGLLGTDENAQAVDAHDSIPTLLGRFQKTLRPIDAAIIEYHIEFAVFGNSPRHQACTCPRLTTSTVAAMAASPGARAAAASAACSPFRSAKTTLAPSAVSRQPQADAPAPCRSRHATYLALQFHESYLLGVFAGYPPSALDSMPLRPCEKCILQWVMPARQGNSPCRSLPRTSGITGGIGQGVQGKTFRPRRFFLLDATRRTIVFSAEKSRLPGIELRQPRPVSHRCPKTSKSLETVYIGAPK